MQALIDLFVNFFETVGNIISFLIDSVADLIYVVTAALSYVAQLPTYFFWLPGETLGVFGACISVLIILRIAGRDG